MDNNQNSLPTLPPLPTPPVSPFAQMPTEQTPSMGSGAPEMQLPRKKSNTFKSVVMPVLALFLVAGVATASYFVSNRLSQQGKVALNAPESEPMAAGDDCTVSPNSCPKGYKCVENDKGNGVCKEIKGGEDPGTCTGGDTPGCTNGTICGTQVCTGNKSKCCPNGCKAESESCDGTSNGDNGGTCSSENRDTKPGNTLTFEKAGTIAVFTREFKGTITLTRASGAAVTITSTQGGNAVKQSTTFNVSEGEVLTLVARQTGNPQNGAGWIKNKTATKCGPSKGACGDDKDISAVINLAKANGTLDSIFSGNATSSANVQCWEDMSTGDVTQDFEYNDFTIVLAYANVPAAACVNAQLAYKDTATTWAKITDKATIPTKIKAGDTVRIYAVGSAESTKARFKVTNGTTNLFTTEWVEVTSSTAVTNGKEYYYEFTMGTAGTYSFEAQVQ